MLKTRRICCCAFNVWNGMCRHVRGVFIPRPLEGVAVKGGATTHLIIWFTLTVMMCVCVCACKLC